MNFLSLIFINLSLILVFSGSKGYEEITIVKPEIHNSSGTDSLATIEIEKGSGIYFSYPVNSLKLIMQACDSLHPQDDWFCPEPIYSRNWRLGEWTGTSEQASFTIYFSPGPSEDPEFIFVNLNGKEIGRIPALKLLIGSDFMIHASGHTNNMFNKMRLFRIEKDTLMEIKQPFYHVGLEGELLRNITLYSDETCERIQQVLNRGDEVEIVLALPAGKHESYERIYLLRTSSGITGYIRIESEDTYGALLEGFFYAGD